MGCTADPWGAAQARYQCRPNHRGQVHGNEKTAAVARLEDLPAQSRGRHRRNGHVCRADGVVSIALRTFDPTACAPGAAVVGGNSPSEHPMGRTAIDRSVRLEGRTAIPYSFATEIVPMGTPSFGVLGLWAFETDRSRRARHGRTLALHIAPHELRELRVDLDGADFTRLLRCHWYLIGASGPTCSNRH